MREETQRYVESEGARCLLIAGDVKDPAFCTRGRGEDGRRRSAGSTCWSTTPRSRSTPTRSRTSPTSTSRKPCRPTSSATSTWRARRCRTWQTGGSHHQHRLGDRPVRQQGPARLLGDQGRDPRLHQVAGQQPARDAASASMRSRRGRCGRRSIRPTSRPNKVREFGKDSDMKRPAQPEELSPAYVFLAVAGVRQLHQRHRAAGDGRADQLIMGSLRDYQRKRDFSRTREPADNDAAAPGPARDLRGAAAPRLAPALRLPPAGRRCAEEPGRCRRGRATTRTVKRMAVEVEDHPVVYATFEGEIPKGQYGGGHVALFDPASGPRRTTPRRNSPRATCASSCSASKLKGGWHLVRSGKPAKQPQWLLFKEKDEYAGDARGRRPARAT